MKSARLLRAGALLAFALGSLRCGQQQESQTSQAPALETEDDKTLYAIGVAVAGNTLGAFQGQFDQRQVDLIIAGFRDAVQGNEPQVAMEQYGPELNQYLQDMNRQQWAEEAETQKAEGDAFLAEAAARDETIQTESGLVYEELVLGTGPQPTEDDTVRVHYHGTLTDGTVFSSSVEQGEPIVHPMSGLIPGWREGLSMMHVGGKARLVIPPELAYGDRPVGEIPAGATLVFEMELLGIE